MRLLDFKQLKTNHWKMDDDEAASVNFVLFSSS
jgi:hypothetical protein